MFEGQNSIKHKAHFKMRIKRLLCLSTNLTKYSKISLTEILDSDTLNLVNRYPENFYPEFLGPHYPEINSRFG